MNLTWRYTSRSGEEYACNVNNGNNAGSVHTISVKSSSESFLPRGDYPLSVVDPSKEVVEAWIEAGMPCRVDGKREWTLEQLNLLINHKNRLPGDTRATFVSAFESVSDEAHFIATEKGFWDKDRSDMEAIALMHSELSEALEAVRKPGKDDEHCPEFKNIEIEFADVIIRIMDTAQARNYRVAEALVAKMAVNACRPRMHGKTC